MNESPEYCNGWNDGYAARDEEGWRSEKEIEARVLFAIADECEQEQGNTGRARAYRDRMRRTKQVLLWHANRKKQQALASVDR